MRREENHPEGTYRCCKLEKYSQTVLRDCSREQKMWSFNVGELQCKDRFDCIDNFTKISTTQACDDDTLCTTLNTMMWLTASPTLRLI